MAGTGLRRAVAALAVGACLLGLLGGRPAFIGAHAPLATQRPRAVGAGGRGAASRTQVRAEVDSSGLLPSGPVVAYTEALIDAAAKKGESVPVTKDVMKIKGLFANEEWKEELSLVVNEPGASQVDKATAMLKMMEPLESKVMPKFIVFLAKKTRLLALKPITDEYVTTLYESQKITPVVVRSAERLSDAQKTAIKDKMKKKTGASDIKLISEVDSSLLGGFVVEWGFTDPETLDTPTEGVDLSLKSYLSKKAVSQGVLVEV